MPVSTEPRFAIILLTTSSSSQSANDLEMADLLEKGVLYVLQVKGVSFKILPEPLSTSHGILGTPY